MSELRSQRLASLRAHIPEVEPTDPIEGVLIDVREAHEIAAGSPPGALRLGRGMLELRVEGAVPETDTPIVCMCAAGIRSLFAAEDLRQLGYTDVRSMRGGFGAWKQAGLPIEVPHSLDRARYARHLLLPEVGEEGQLRLDRASVLLVGAGGLGSPAALYLAAAGVGTLGIVDDDLVDRSNLQRQVLHSDDAVGQPKVESARRRIEGLNPNVSVQPHALRLTKHNVDDLVPRYDLVLDGADNFATRYMLNDACLKHAKPLVHGSVYRFEGQVSVFGAPGPCYRCIFPEAPPPELAPSCAEAGVLGVLPGVIGLLQATEALKILLGVGEPLRGRLLSFDALSTRFTTLRLSRDPKCGWCSGAFPGYATDYAQSCSA